MNKLFRKLLLCYLLLAVFVPNAWARLDGAVEMGYAHFEQSGNRDEDEFTASHFTHRYSLMYGKKGLLAGGRAGSYDVGIGAEWGSFTTDLDGDTYGIDASKILYDGHVQIAPGGLPFRLNAYSYDTQKIIFNQSRRPGSRQSYESLLFSPNIVSDLMNGQTIVSGVQFIAGIRNGSYLGKYRELLSKWPRLLVDYRDVYRIDKKSENPHEYRDRNLAFVSLNKKDNWFHYRILDHEDYLDSSQNSNVSTIMLGTIDHALKRQWINLTNWIRISVDGSYSEEKNAWETFASKRFDVNFFSLMQRTDFDAKSFVTMYREQRENRITHELDVPVYLNNRLNPDTSIRSSFKVWRKKVVDEDYDESLSEEAYYSKVLVQTRKRSRVNIDPSVEMEIYTRPDSEGGAVRVALESYSNRHLGRKRTSLHGMGSLALFNSTDELSNNLDLWESTLQGGLSSPINNNVRVGLEQDFVYGEGISDADDSHFMSSSLSAAFTDNSDDLDKDRSLLRSESVFFFEHRSRSQVLNRFTLSYKFEDNDGARSYATEFTHNLKFRSRWWHFDVENTYAMSENSDFNLWENSDLSSRANAGKSDGLFLHRSNIKFTPNNYWKSSLDSIAVWSDGGSGSDDAGVNVEQRVTRTFFAKQYVRRVLGDITQSVSFRKLQNSDGRRDITFGLRGNYRPTSYWRLGAGLYYRDYNYQSNALFCSLTTGLNFPLFAIDLSYNYGESDSGVVAHRYEANVKKTF